MIKANNQNAVKTRQKFDQTFKREAVNNWLTSGKSAGVVAGELVILPNRQSWQQQRNAKIMLLTVGFAAILGFAMSKIFHFLYNHQ